MTINQAADNAALAFKAFFKANAQDLAALGAAYRHTYRVLCALAGGHMQAQQAEAAALSRMREQRKAA